jgi:hypothetical protein
MTTTSTARHKLILRKLIVMETVENVNRGGDKALPAVPSTRPLSSTKPTTALTFFCVVVRFAKVLQLSRYATDMKTIRKEIGNY